MKDTDSFFARKSDMKALHQLPMPDSTFWIKIVCALFAFLLYLNTIEYGFVYDDHRAILTNDDLLSSTPISALLEHDFWGRPVWHAGSHKSYRPLAVLSLRLNDALAGGNLRPGPLHLGNAILHAIVTALLTHLAALLLLHDLKPMRSAECKWTRKSLTENGISESSNHEKLQLTLQRKSREPSKSLTSTPIHQRRSSSCSLTSSTECYSIRRDELSANCRRKGVLFTGLLFASHPVHTEAVCGLVGRADVGAALFSLLALLSYRRHVQARDSNPSSLLRSVVPLGAAVLFGIAAMLFKEHGIAALPLCTMYDALVHCRGRPVMSFLQCIFKVTRVSSMSHAPLHSLNRIYANHEGSPTKLSGKAKSSDIDRGFYQSLVAIIIAVFALLAIRCVALAGGLPTFSSSDNPASRSNSLITRTLTFLYLPVLNLNLLLCPTTLSFDWSMDAVPLVKSFVDKRNIISCVMYISFMYLIVKLLCLVVMKDLSREWSSQIIESAKQQNINDSSNDANSSDKCLEASIGLFSICMTVLPFLPATNLIAYVGFVIAERVLYVPSMGYCLLLGVGLSNILIALDLHLKKWTRVLRIIVTSGATLMLIIFTVQTVVRSGDWRDEERLYRSGISVNPAKAYGNLGNVLSNLGRIDEAEMAYRKALQHRPNMADAHFNLGLLLQNKGVLQESVECYERAIKFRPSLAVAHLNMGLTLVRMGKYEEGIKRLRLIAENGGERIGDPSLLKDPRSHEIALASARFHLGRILVQNGQLSEALEILHDALHRMPPHYSPQSLLNMLGEVYRQMGLENEAESWFRASLKSKPDHIPAYLTYARLLADNKTRKHEAEQQFLKALDIAPKDNTALHQYGRFLVEQGRHAEAAEYFKLATEVSDPPHFEDVMAAATSYRLSGNLQKAESFYRKGVLLQPELHSAHVNLGAFLHLVGQYEEAEKCYKTALQFKPGDQLTLNNLHRLHAKKSSHSKVLSRNTSKQMSTSKNGNS